MSNKKTTKNFTKFLLILLIPLFLCFCTVTVGTVVFLKATSFKAINILPATEQERAFENIDEIPFKLFNGLTNDSNTQIEKVYADRFEQKATITITRTNFNGEIFSAVQSRIMVEKSNNKWIVTEIGERVKCKQGFFWKRKYWHNLSCS